jgi:hypothetical protein
MATTGHGLPRRPSAANGTPPPQVDLGAAFQSACQGVLQDARPGVSPVIVCLIRAENETEVYDG